MLAAGGTSRGVTTRLFDDDDDDAGAQSERIERIACFCVGAFQRARADR